MDALQFAYWLQGFAELGGDEPPTPAQWRSIRDHLGLVFNKVTPEVGRISDRPDIGELLKHINKQSPAVPYIMPPYEVKGTAAGDPLAGRAVSIC